MTTQELLARLRNVLHDLGAAAITESDATTLRLGSDDREFHTAIDFCVEPLPLRLHINARLPATVPSEQRFRFSDAIAQANLIAAFGRFVYEAHSGHAGYTSELILVDAEATDLQLRVYVRTALEAVRRFFPALRQIVEQPMCDIDALLANVEKRMQHDTLRKYREGRSASEWEVEEDEGTRSA